MGAGLREGRNAWEEGAHSGGEERRTYVVFCLGEERMAVPMERVVEIIRVPEVVRVPLGPACLEGLANLRGSVLPVVDLRTALGRGRGEETEATRVLVADCGGPVGFRVDRIERIIRAGPEAIHAPEGAGEGFSREIVREVIRGGGRGLVSVLDLERLVAMRLGEGLPGGEGVRAGDGGCRGGGRKETPGTGEEDEAAQLVVVELGGEEYGFPIEAVEEIVRFPEEVSPVPGAGDGAVLGLTDLRGNVLPVVSLRGVFGMGERAADEGTRVVVVRGRGGGRRVGVVVDRVREVLQVSRDVREAVPAALRRSRGRGQIVEVCRLEGGRLVGVVSVSELVRIGGMVEGACGEGQGDVGAGAGEEGEETRMVVFALGGEAYGVDVSHVQEIIRVPEVLTPVPRAPEFIEGLANLRGLVLPVVDLRVRFGLERAERCEAQRIVVLDVEGARTGFIVDGVSEVRRVERGALEPAPELSEEQARVIRGVVRVEGRGRLVLVVDPEALVVSSGVEGSGPEAEAAEAA